MSTATQTQTLTKIKLPSMFKVVMLNDDTTPFDFVIQVLQFVFEKSRDEAEALTQRIHQDGRAIVGVYTLEMARQKVDDTHQLSQKYNYDLKVIKEEA